MTTGKWFVVPVSNGEIRWKPETWGVLIEYFPVSLPDSTTLGGLRPVDPARLRLPWKTLAQMLLTRDQ